MEPILEKHAGLYTDLYELTMAQGYFLAGRAEEPAVFDYFFRENPFEGGYVVFCGLPEVLEVLENLHFEEDDLRYLEEKGFRKEFLEHLKGFRFRGSVWAAREGEVVFPLEPVARVEGGLLEAQIVETLLLNLVNFQSLIATKTARVVQAAQGRRVVDFGLRRAQGLGGLHASRAAAVGGAQATSNVMAAMRYGLTPTGTQAHSWIQSFESELEAFRRFAETFPDPCILLVDTYDTLRSGIPNAIRTAKELERKGRRLLAVRLDSGDLAYLSKRARRMLDEAGLPYVKIVVSNQLDEYLVHSLIAQGAPVNAFGVGTQLVTGGRDSALDGVYKLALCGGRPVLKLSENPAKITLPGRKKTLRFSDAEGRFECDGVALEEERTVETIFHPFHPDKKTDVRHCFPEKILFKMMEGGRVVVRTTVREAAEYAAARLSRLPPEHKRFENPHTYKVGLSGSLRDLRDRLVREAREQLEAPPEGG